MHKTPVVAPVGNALTLISTFEPFLSLAPALPGLFNKEVEVQKDNAALEKETDFLERQT